MTAQIWAYVERGAGDQARAAELMEASTKLAGARPAALASAARFFVDVGAPGAKRAARKLYERALQRDPDHAPSLQVGSTLQPLCMSTSHTPRCHTPSQGLVQAALQVLWCHACARAWL